MIKKSSINLLCLFGIVSVVFYFLHDVIGAIYYPNYNWLSQAVSDLTATNAPSYQIASLLSNIYGITNLICCISVCIISKNKNKTLKIGIYLFAIMNLISAIGYFMFPLTNSGYDGTFQSFIHVYVITVLVVILSIISLILIVIGSIKNNNAILGYLALTTLILMFVGAIGSGNVPVEYFGLFERFSTYSAVIFTGILGIYGFKEFST